MRPGDIVKVDGVGEGVVQRVLGQGAEVRAPSSTGMGQSLWLVLCKDVEIVKRRFEMKTNRDYRNRLRELVTGSDEPLEKTLLVLLDDLDDVERQTTEEVQDLRRDLDKMRDKFRAIRDLVSLVSSD